MDSNNGRKYFGAVDYALFALTLLVSSIIGIYFAYKQRKNMSSAEYLVASRSLSWFPIFVSMVASFMSAIGLMGIPAQVYSTGVTFLFILIAIFVPISLSAEIFTPLFRRIKLVSANEYLEKRFSPSVRIFGCILYTLKHLIYLSVALFAPSLALESVAGVPKYITILSTGVVCTFYTSLGGMKAVIWTDVFQSAVMIVGLVATVIAGIADVGSFEKIFKVAGERDRLSINFSLDPRQYHTIWGITFGLSCTQLVRWCVGQPTIQRAVAAKSLKDAKRALYASYAAIVVITILLTLDAFIIYAVYSECDLLTSKKITQNDQIFPYFVVNKLGHITGMPGLFTACLFSFALSTLSSGLNGLSAMFSEDILLKIRPNKEDSFVTNMAKVYAIVCGVFVTGFAFIVPYLGKYVLKLSIQLNGIIGGPYFSMFALGIFTERCNKFGAIVGAGSGFLTGSFFSFGQMMYSPDRQLPPISIRECSFFNATLSNTTGIIYPKGPVHTDAIAAIFSLSYLWYGVLTIFISLVVGYVASICAEKYIDVKDIDKNLLYDYEKSWLYSIIKNNKKSSKVQNELLLIDGEQVKPSETTKL